MVQTNSLPRGRSVVLTPRVSVTTPTGRVVRSRAWLDERRRRLATWLVLAAPLVFLPGGFSRFVLVKLLLIALAALVAARVPAAGRLPRVLTIGLGAALGLFVLAALVGATPVASLLGRWPRYEGVPVLLLYGACLWLGAHLVGRGAARLDALLDGLAVLALALAGFSALELAGWAVTGVTTAERSGSVLGNATDQGLVAMMLALALAPRVLDAVLSGLVDGDPGVGASMGARLEAVWVTVAGLVAALATVAMSASRAALLLTAVGLVALAVLGRGALRGSRALRAAAATVGGALLILLAAALAIPAVRERLGDSTTVRSRWLQWDLTLDLIADRPWLGWGPSRYVDVVGRYETAAWTDHVGSDTAVDSPHNVLLQLLVAGGVPLLLAGLAIAGWSAWRALAVVREAPPWAGVGLAVAAYGVGMLANFPIAGSTCLAAFLAGALLADPAREGTAVWVPPTRMVAAGAAALALAAGCLGDLRLQAGLDHLAAGRSTEAVAAFDSAADLRPGDGDTPMLAAQALARLASDTQDPVTADATRRFARESLDRTPDTYAARLAAAVADVPAGELEQARETLDALVADFPRRGSARVQRAIVRFGLRDVAGARADLDHAISLDPRDRSARTVLRRIERRLAQMD